MTTSTEVQEHATGETCPGCESEIVALSAAADELCLQCDCGEAIALAPRNPHLADAA
ncbi:MAG: hypothetical protein ACLGIB_10150 [Actinomycetota bacterium]